LGDVAVVVAVGIRIGVSKVHWELAILRGSGARSGWCLPSVTRDPPTIELSGVAGTKRY